MLPEQQHLANVMLAFGYSDATSNFACWSHEYIKQTAFLCRDFYNYFKEKIIGDVFLAVCGRCGKYEVNSVKTKKYCADCVWTDTLEFVHITYLKPTKYLRSVKISGTYFGTGKDSMYYVFRDGKTYGVVINGILKVYKKYEIVKIPTVRNGHVKLIDIRTFNDNFAQSYLTNFLLLAGFREIFGAFIKDTSVQYPVGDSVIAFYTTDIDKLLLNYKHIYLIQSNRNISKFCAYFDNFGKHCAWSIVCCLFEPRDHTCKGFSYWMYGKGCDENGFWDFSTPIPHKLLNGTYSHCCNKFIE